MKVLLLTDRMGRGGAETHVASLARALQKMHVEVAVASLGGSLADELEREGIPQIRLPFSTHNPLRLFALRRALIRLLKRERYDVLHAHARIPAFLIRGLKKYGSAEVVSVHARFSLSPLLRRICHWGDATIAVSEDLRQYVHREYGIPFEQVRVIPNGIDCARFCSKERSTPSQTIRILFASRLDHDCSLGASLLCSIAPTLVSRFPNLTIAIAGGGNAYEEIKRQAAEANRRAGTPVVTLLGEIGDMASELQKSDIVIGVSRVAMEAAVSGCAVVLCGNEGYFGILTKVNAPEAQLSNFCGRGMPLPSAQTLKKDLLVLLENPKLTEHCKRELSSLAREEWSADRMARKTLALYHRASHPPYEHEITVGGYFGCGNLGDDAILQGFLQGLHDTAPQIRVSALTGNPRFDRRRFGVRCQSRKHPVSFLRSATHSSAFLLGGGSLLQNATSNRSLSFYLCWLRLFRFFGARTVLYSAGIGPLFGARPKKVLTRILNSCSYISLRDPDSLRLLEALGVSRPLLHLGADPALLLSPPPASRKTMLLSQNRLPADGSYLCIVLKGGDACADIRRIMEGSARMLAARHGLLPIFLVFDRKKDLAQTQIASRKTGWRIIELGEVGDAIAILSAARLTLTMRLHALVLATVALTPAIALSPDPKDEKTVSFARLSAQEVIRPEELSVAHLVERAEYTLQNRHTLIPLLADALQDLRKKAKKDLENIVTMIYNSK